jgi:succinate dehydrogenase / fumarate reductase flavoprotein subunit
LEEKYPKYGNLVPRDIATREIFQVCLDGFSVDPRGNMVYLDLGDITRQLGRKAVLNKLEGILETYEKFIGTDPLDEPMRIFPAVHYTMGGLWMTYTKDDKSGGLKYGAPNNMMTNIPGLYTMGEASFAYHGANRLGANSLLSCIFDGLFGAPGIKNYITEHRFLSSAEVEQSAFDSAVAEEADLMNRLISSTGDENPYSIWNELGRLMNENCTVVRYNDRIDRLIDHIDDFKRRYPRIRLSDTGLWTNQNLSFARALGDMLLYAEAIAKAARLRNESRGAHYKPEFPERDDASFLRTTLAKYDSSTDRAIIEHVPVDVSLIPPRARTYGKTDKQARRESVMAPPPAVPSPRVVAVGA